MQGLIHLYCGDGKGKTTAAVGLSVRAAGAGKRVLFAQFLKDGSSSELNVLRALQNVEVACCTQNFGFFKAMDGQTKAAAQKAYSALLEDVMRKSADGRRSARARRGGRRLQPRLDRRGNADRLSARQTKSA